MHLFSFFGPPGSGKGTLAQLLEKKHGFEVLSTGNLCRREIAQGTELGKTIDSLLKNGQLIPDELISSLVLSWLEERSDNSFVVLDGFPRTRAQAELFKEQFTVVFFEISRETIIKRLSSRRTCSNKDCQAVYSLVSAPPKIEGKCDICGSAVTSRLDDEPAVISQRLAVYKQHEAALLDYYSSRGFKVIQLNVEGIDPNEVLEKFLALVDRDQNQR